MKPRTRNIVIVIVVAAVVTAGIGAFYLLSKASATCGPHERTTICVDQAEIPDSLDPAYTFTTPGWAAVQQVYQGLVNYNGTSSTSFVGVLAQNWTNSSDGLHWNFTLRSGVTFSNGDPYNAYVQWYSLYRTLLMEQGPQFIIEENFYSQNLSGGPTISYYSPLAQDQAANRSLVNDLNSFNFDSPTASQLAAMSFKNQSFVVLSPNEIQLNLGFGYLASAYAYLLASISAPTSYAVDPNWVDQHGGVVEGQPNDYVATNAMGTGQYVLENYNGVQGGGYALKVNPNYWGKTSAAATPWNNMIQPANTSVQVTFQAQTDVTVNDLSNGNVQEASFAYLGPSTILQLQGKSNLNVSALPTIYGATSGSWWIFLNQSHYPFNNLSVREAIAHSIDYGQIIQRAFGGFASQWVGPVPPQYPYYNPGNLPPYSYNLTLAKAEIANSPCANNACAGTSITYGYLTPGDDWAETAQFLKADFAAIGITINPVGISLTNLIAEQKPSGGVCPTATTQNGGPFFMGQEFYTSDYISPDDWTQNDALSLPGTGSANICESGYSNATMNADVYAAAADSNPADLTALYTNMTSLMYNNYTDIWLVVPTSFSVQATNVHGYVHNPMASAEPFSLLFNTQWLS